MRTAITCTVGVLLTAALVLTACNGPEDIEPPDSISPAPITTSPTPVSNIARTPEPDPQTLDDDTAAELYVAWRAIVYGLPPTPPEAVDVDTVADAIVLPGSEASDWITQELQLARDRGVVVRGSIHAEPISAVDAADDRATVAICSSADVRVTDVATGDPVGDETVDPSYTRFDVAYRLVDDTWLVEQADPSDQEDCVPPSLDEAVAARWELFTEAWYERDRQGGGEALGQLTAVVTDRFAETLGGLPSRDPVPDPAAFTDLELVAATRTSATGQACRSGGLEIIEWLLVDGQWQVDFAGQFGQEVTPCS
jgi:hypothetical protein